MAATPPGPKTVMTIFGTRPEIIKMAPVISHLAATPNLRSVVVSSGQHRELLAPLIRLFEVCVDHNLDVMQPGQSPNQTCARILAALDPVLEEEKPDVVLVQGDTTTALTGALAAFYRQIPIGHIEAGLRTQNAMSPYPEEMNRRLISRMASFHFAATAGNRAALLKEGVEPSTVFVTGNPVVDALGTVLNKEPKSARIQEVLRRGKGYRNVVLTTHRRESFDGTLEKNLTELRSFVERHSDIRLIFPVHPNPIVKKAAEDHLTGHERIDRIEPLDYCDFLTLLSEAWLIVSDSGGIQEEAPTLGVPLLVLRKSTERPEAIECGCARLVGDVTTLRSELERAYQHRETKQAYENPFGNGSSGEQIVQALLTCL